ncbi:MAG: hypothetical protein RL017_352 [Pseudomonadota bacterium]|jgi:xylose isomerase
MVSYFNEIDKINFAGPDTEKQLAYRYYDANRMVLNKTMAEHLKIAVCYWHSFCWHGGDAFGAATRNLPWEAESNILKRYENKLDAAIEFVTKLGVKYLTFHDIDLAPEGNSPQEYQYNLNHMVDKLGQKLNDNKLQVLWGTANVFSHPRYMSGAATNPNPEIFARAAFQVKNALTATKNLGGLGYVLWGGREGYDTTLNTNIAQELEQLGRFLTLVAEYKHKIGFKGSLYIEPKPCEPTKRQYDFDAATVYALLQKFDLVQEYKLNLEANHATLAGHSFTDEIAYACANNLLGSIDINRGDAQNGWDTDQFPNSVEEMALVLYEIFRHGGLTNGGFNFDAKVRRQSNSLHDMFYAHVGAIDVLAKSLLAAEELIVNKRLSDNISSRYSGWQTSLGSNILQGKVSLEDLAKFVVENNKEVNPPSGQQELCENIVNQAIWKK